MLGDLVAVFRDENAIEGLLNPLRLPFRHAPKSINTGSLHIVR